MSGAKKLSAKLAASRYRHPAKNLRVLTIAGPYGKTTTALLLAEILQEAGHSVLTLTNRVCKLNDQTLEVDFVPKAGPLQRLLAIGRKKKVDFVILEVNQAVLDSHVLSTITLEMSIITGDSSEANALSEQPVAYTVVPSSRSSESAQVVPHQAISFGDDELADARIKNVKLYQKGTEVSLVIDHHIDMPLATHLIGRANAYNVAAAVAAAYVLSVDTSRFEEGVARLEYVPGNYEHLPLDRLYAVVVDGAHIPRSLDLVVADAKKLTKRRLLVVADESVTEQGYAKVRPHASGFIAVGAHDGPGIKGASDNKVAAEVTLRGAKQEDTVLFLGKQYASQDSENLSVAQRMVEATSEQ